MTQERKDQLSNGQRPAVLYLRVASANQLDQDDRLRQQRAACMRAAERNGFTVTEEFADLGRSANRLNHGGLRNLIEWISDGNIKYVIVADRVRIARNIADYLYIVEHIERAGATLVFADDDRYAETTLSTGGAR